MNSDSLHARSFRHIYTSPFLDTGELRLALQAQKAFWDFEKRATGHFLSSLYIFE